MAAHEGIPPTVVGRSGTLRHDAPAPAALAGVRVLELADEQGEYCGWLLAGMGADVIKLEPPGGGRTRTIPPFAGDSPHPDRSLYFWHYNVGKRAVTLDLATAEGQGLFRRLAAMAAVVVETRPPGHLDRLGIGPRALGAEHPGLIVASITPFGQDGPFRDAPGTDLTAMALGGSAAACGYPPSPDGGYDTPPLVCEGNQALLTASVYAGQAIVAALMYRERTGVGQHIDVSIHEAAASITEWHVPLLLFADTVMPRGILGLQCRARDGLWVSCIIPDFFGPHVRDALLEILDRDGLGAPLRDPAPSDAEGRRETRRRLEAAVADFVARHDADEVYRIGQARGLPWAPIRTADENLDDAHLRDRGFFVDVVHDELGATYPYAGAPFAAGATPWRFARRPPLVGEHNEEIYGGILGLRAEEIAALRTRGIV